MTRMNQAVNIDDVRAQAETDRLLEDTWEQRSRVTRRQLLVAVIAAAGFLAVASALALVSPPAGFDPALTGALVIGYAALSLIEFPLGRGYVVPTQLALVPMLFAVSPGLVPLLVAGGLLAGAVVDVASGRGPRHRLLFSIPDAWHAIGPAAVFVAAGDPAADLDVLGILALAFVAQWTVDTLAVIVRDWVTFGTPPELQLRVVAHVALFDALLSPVGLLVAYAGASDARAMLLAAPLAGLLVVLARERTVRIRQAHERLEAVRRERERLQQAIQRIGEAFGSTLDFDALLEISLRSAADAVHADAGRTSVVRPDRDGVVAHATVGDAVALAAALDAAEDRVVTGDGPAQAQDGDVSALAWPIGNSADGSAGVLAVARRGEPFTEGERSLLGYLVSQANVSVQNIAHHEALQQEAVTDSLTGLANRRRFRTLLTGAAEDFRLHGTPAALVMLDIDNFKRVNDWFGHQVGDDVLRETARAVRRACRGDDQAARYGGEEIAVLLTGASAANARRFAERVRAVIASTSVPLATGEELRVTASFGIAWMSDHVRVPAALVSAADSALYAAKHAGKDRVVAAGDALDRQGALVADEAQAA